VRALCVISAALGAAIDRYLAGAIEQGGPHLERAVSPKAAVAAPAEMNVEVLGDMMRCSIPRIEDSCDRVSLVQTQVHGR
jgi:hypothetical protein